MTEVTAACVHGIAGARCETCETYRDEPLLTSELDPLYAPPDRTGQTTKLEATGDAFHGPRPERPYSPGPIVANGTTRERLDRAARERERTRPRHNYVPLAKGQAFITDARINRDRAEAEREQAKRNATKAPKGKRQSEEELDALIAAMVANPGAFIRG